MASILFWALPAARAIRLYSASWRTYAQAGIHFYCFCLNYDS
jgi:hypothetical protein